MSAEHLPEPVSPPRQCTCERPLVDVNEDPDHCERCGFDLPDRRPLTADDMMTVLVRYIHERHAGHLGPGVMDTELATRMDRELRLFITERLGTLGVAAILGPSEPLPPLGEWNSPADLAARWGTSRWSVYRRRDRIPFRRRNGRLEASREDVERFEREERR